MMSVYSILYIILLHYYNIKEEDRGGIPDIRRVGTRTQYARLFDGHKT